jgi:small subunit ribosomal protein S6
MRNYEVTFIVDPVLSGDEIKATAQTYVDHLKNEGCTIVHMDEMGLKQLAYPIKKRTSGVYFCIEFQAENGTVLAPLELAFRRDERIMRFLSIALDKYGVKYNDDKRNGRIGTAKKRRREDTKDDKKDDRRRGRGGRRDASSSRPAPKKPAQDAPKKEEPKKEATAATTAPAKEEEE